MFKVLDGSEDIDSKMFFKLKEDSKIRGHKATLVKTCYRIDTKTYSSQRTINKWNKLSHGCVIASSVNDSKLTVIWRGRITLSLNI